MTVDKKMKFEQYRLKNRAEFDKYEKIIKSFHDQLKTSNHRPYIIIAQITYKLKLVEIIYNEYLYYEELYHKFNEVILDKMRKQLNEILLLLKMEFSFSKHPEFSKNPNHFDELTPTRMYSLLSQLNFYCKFVIERYGPLSKFIVPLATMYGDFYYFSLNNINLQKYLVTVRDLSHPENVYATRLIELIGDFAETAAATFMRVFKNTQEQHSLHSAVLCLTTIIPYFRMTNQSDKIPEIERKVQTWERLIEKQDSK